MLAVRSVDAHPRQIHIRVADLREEVIVLNSLDAVSLHSAHAPRAVEQLQLEALLVVALNDLPELRWGAAQAAKTRRGQHLGAKAEAIGPHSEAEARG